MIPLVAPCYLGSEVVFPDEGAVTAFERAFAKRVSAKYAVAVNSGTSALMLALRVLGFTRQHVRVPTYSCVSLLHAVHGGGGFAEFEDVTFDVRSAGATVKTGADVVVDLFGRRTLSFAAAVQDVTLSLGGVDKFHGRIGVCSTHKSKMISTDRGGVVFTDDEELAHRVRRAANYEDFPYNGGVQYSLGMSSMQAALGVSQLGQLDSFIARRRELARFYSSRFEAAGIVCPDAECGSVFFRYLISVNDPQAKLERLGQLRIECGRGVYPPLHRLAGLPDDDFPGATQAVNSLLSIPVHSSITDSQAEYIAEKVVETCAR